MARGKLVHGRAGAHCNIPSGIAHPRAKSGSIRWVEVQGCADCWIRRLPVRLTRWANSACGGTVWRRRRTLGRAVLRPWDQRRQQ